MNPWRDLPTLAGRHVTLRPLVESDLPALVAAAAADGLWDMFYASVAQLKLADNWFARACAEQESSKSLVFAVLDGDGAVTGTTRLMELQPADRRAEIGGTFYATRVQRTGVNTEAKLLLLTHAFDVLRCQCVHFQTDSLNRRSQAAIERLGAKRDGVLRGHRIVDGRVRDSVVYSILAHEWPAVRMNLEYLLERHG